MIRILVGTKNPIKLEAVEAAAAALGLQAEVVGVAAGSGVPPQPYGRQETLQGAITRALMAQATDAEAYAIGIENGLVPDGGSTFDLAYAVVITPEAGLFALPSEAVPVPDELVEASLASGRSVTAGELQAERNGGDSADPHRVWSGGKTDRKTLLTDVLMKALLAATSTLRGEPS